ncbi:hypothetical protein TI39_contig4338g00008 [Zymoseptoria brevis]|uniref:Lipoxygenase domain-containing protein n=1 Tax=Zymoseptoria brevis TaxID=1047168 RepID=A0A0F4GAR6_9PEZI|nr:hypothetical protein TI39_contig4338g00008 [Zymoseptoria brevis]
MPRESPTAFTGTYCESYYDPADANALDDDPELQAWMTEAIAAQVIDFPAPSTLRNVSDLADLMAHIGFIVSVAQHTVNTNELLTGSGVLPFHTSALWQPVHEQKGVHDVVPFLPKFDAALATIDLCARFSRPKFVGTNRTLLHMFEGEELMRRSNPAVRAANEAFMKTISAQSNVVSGRATVSDGLSQGRPFLWQIMDPDVIPWNVAI